MSQHILVVAGDRVLRESVGRLLCDHGHQVDQAGSGAKALERALGSHFDAVVLDLNVANLTDKSLGRLLMADMPRRQAPALVGMVEPRHATLVSKASGGMFKAILSKPLDPEALLDAIEADKRKPHTRSRDLVESPQAARDLSMAHWRRFGLRTLPKVFACPHATPDQARALALCFDLVNRPDADLIILLERHGMAEVKGLARRGDEIAPPVIALSPDHADLCDAFFEIGSEASWRQIAALVRHGAAPSRAPAQGSGALAARSRAENMASALR